MTLNLLFEKASPEDAEQITALINSAYRGESSRQGWTTEADLLEGRRTELTDILTLMAQPQSMFIVGKQTEQIQASVLLQQNADNVFLSMLAVNPLAQNQGIGKALLQAAELAAQQTWAAKRLTLSVIDCRSELIAFYQRRGYQQTGMTEPFPMQTTLWTAKVNHLRLAILEKVLD